MGGGGGNCSLCPSCPMGKGRPWFIHKFVYGYAEPFIWLYSVMMTLNCCT
jgi:hypothetical protein